MLLSYIRTAFLYLVLIFGIRLMGKRQVGEMEPAEFVVTMLVANLAAIPMQDGGIPLLSGLVPILTVLGMETVLSFLALRSMGVRHILCGKPVILIDNGRILAQNLRQTDVTLDELLSHLRQKDVLDVAKVQFAILETNGELSVFPFPTQAEAPEAPPRQLPVTLIADGVLLRQNLLPAKKDENWVRKVLSQRSASIASTLLLMLDSTGNIIFFPKEDGK